MAADAVAKNTAEHPTEGVPSTVPGTPTVVVTTGPGAPPAMPPPVAKPPKTGNKHKANPTPGKPKSKRLG